MRKGVSPVVAAVLLIAIAVIAAVAVWYWVSPLTARPATTGTTQMTISVERCYDGAELDIRNVGGIAIPAATNFTIYKLSDGSTANAWVDMGTALDSGAVAKKSISGAAPIATSTAYFLLAQGIPSATFSC